MIDVLIFICVPEQMLNFTNYKNIRIRSLLSLNSQMVHIVINGYENVGA